MDDKHLLLNTEAEQDVLGCLMIQPRCFAEAAETLTEEHFSREAHRQLWRWMVAASGTWTDQGEVWDRLIEAGAVEACGGLGYITSLPEMVITVEGLPARMRALEVARQRRALVALQGEIRENIHDPEAARNTIRAKLQELESGDRASWTEAAALAQMTLRAVEDRIQAKKEGRLAGWGTGIPGVDRLTGGLRAPQYWVVGARPGMGKSALVLQMLLHLARSGLKCALFSLEMPQLTAGMRMVCRIAGADAAALRDGRIDRDGLADIEQAAHELSTLPLIVDDRPASPAQLVARMDLLAQRWDGLDVVAVDYLQLMQREKGERYGSRAEEVGEASHKIQAALKSIGCAGLVVGSLNRELEKRGDKRPTAADLRESGDIESDADTILMLYRPHKYDEKADPGKMEVLVRKARHGEEGTVQARWDGAKQSIIEEDSRR